MKIKQLEWENELPLYPDEGCTVKTLFGEYCVYPHSDDCGGFYYQLFLEVNGSPMSVWQFNVQSIEKGKQKCQKDFEEKLNALIAKHIEKD